MANLYAGVRLLPPSHPYLQPANIGKFGIRHVIAEAANNLVLRKENIDQLLVFTAIMTGAVLLLAQIVLLLWSLFVQQAHAAGLFGTVAFDTDIAFMLLDHVFGVPGVFNSCVATGNICPGALTPGPPVPFPFHTALQALFQFYSIGLLLIGALIFLYFVTVVIVETATSGTPFGQRFQDVWVPIRLVVALALLVPVSWGLNSGQYITLYAAKFGSGFATNAWLQFNSSMASSGWFGFLGGQNPTGERFSLIAYPKQGDAALMTEMMSLIHACAYAYWQKDYTTTGASPGVLDPAFKIKPYLIKNTFPWLNDPNPNMLVTNTTTYLQALQFYDYSDIIIRFGELDTVNYKEEKGQVKPICGDIRIRVGDVSSASTGAFNPLVGGPEYITSRYFDLIKDMWFDTGSNFRGFALRYVELTSSNNAVAATRACGPLAGCGNVGLPICTGANPPCATEKPGADWKQNIIDVYQAQMDADIQTAWLAYSILGANIGISTQILDRGWAGAGIWYNRIAELNGSFITSVMDVPVFQNYPLAMEKVRAERLKEDANPTPADMFTVNISNANKTNIEGGEEELAIAQSLNAVYKLWHQDGENQSDQEKTLSTNIIEDAMNILFGTNGLFDMRRENMHTHPLAQLTAVGKGLVESAIRNMAASAATAFLGGFAGAAAANGQSMMAGVFEAFSGFFMSITFIGLTAGFVLFYVLPFLPFVYFYFAVASWVKSIFEAMVGVPLWALAHLRLDGNGLPGEAAQNGYFLIFEIFLRPILTVFGLIAAITILSAQVRVLHLIWDLVTENLAGFNGKPSQIALIGNLAYKRAIVDQFFFTIIYTIIVYMLATASFKLIDRIPDNILRWMGAGVSSFSDINQDATESLTKYAALGGMTFGQQITGGIRSAASGMGRATGSAFANTGGKLAGKGAPKGPSSTVTESSTVSE